MGILMRRRYLRQKIEGANASGETGIALAFQGKLNAVVGTLLPYNIEARVRAALIASNRTTLEDVLGSEPEELIELQYITANNVAALKQQCQTALDARNSTAVLPTNFPSHTALAAAGYTTYQSLEAHSIKQLELIPDIESALDVQTAYNAWLETVQP